MVVVEIRSPVYDEESSQIKWPGRTLVKTDGAKIEVYGEADLVAVDELAVRDLKTGKQLLSQDDPELWARNLPSAYRAGDLVAVVVIDTDPPEVPADPGPSDELPNIPTPSSSEQTAKERVCA